ncbi:hypothetical protein SCHPADRAFT_891867 [Schizopora paradoxa]|uniref:Uncharacterized protein n=1 Tax=Schizopora paradoxa TaxID=27342 RepID=A0A0H2S263_9AGAM|nr:hypothetical protein SCHPADRAFT_891867 [Schizopora paradoxa]
MQRDHQWEQILAQILYLCCLWLKDIVKGFPTSYSEDWTNLVFQQHGSLPVKIEWLRRGYRCRKEDQAHIDTELSSQSTLLAYKIIEFLSRKVSDILVRTFGIWDALYLLPSVRMRFPSIKGGCLGDNENSSELIFYMIGRHTIVGPRAIRSFAKGQRKSNVFTSACDDLMNRSESDETFLKIFVRWYFNVLPHENNSA